jgi:putative FmdB family regulatory protein
MPFYEYECAHCKFYTEVMQKISDAPLEKCPSCGKKALKKLVSAPNFRLKGGGWYETDFKSDKEGKRNIADREEPAAKSQDGKSQDGKAGETKPAAAAETSGKSSESSGGSEGGSSGSKAAGPDDGGGKGRAQAARGSKSAAPPKATGSGRSKPASKAPSKAAKTRPKSAARKKGRR